jgi:hypothetical protein
VQGRQGPFDLGVGGVGDDRPHPRVTDQACPQLVEAPVAVLAVDALIAFAHPEGSVVAPLSLLDHHQLGHRGDLSH